MELKFLKDKVIKKVLAKENKNVRNYVARLISNTTGIRYEVLEDKLELVYPEVSYNAHLVNSEVDLVYADDHVYFNIEINYGNSKVLKIKNLSYLFQLSLRQLKNSKDYQNIKRIIQININSYDPYGYGELLYESQMMVKKFNIVHNEEIIIYDISLPYFEKIDYNKIRNGLLKDLAFLVIEDKEFLDKLYKGDEIMDSVRKELDVLTLKDDRVLFYNKEELDEAIEKEMREKGLKEGLEEGLKEGIKEGTEQTKIEIAKKMLKKGKDIEEISEITGLSKEEIEQL